jgi:type II secretory pathway component PulF
LTFEANDLDGLLKEALVKVRDQIRTADRVIFLMQEGRQFAIKAAHGGRPGRQLPVEKVSRSILRRVRRTGRTLFLSDAMSDNGLGPRRSIQEIGQRSVICAPLKARGKVVGLMYADTVSMIAAFTPAHLQWVNRLTESLNEQLEPLVPGYLETLGEQTTAPGDDPESPLILPLQPAESVRSLPLGGLPLRPSNGTALAEVALAPDHTPLGPEEHKARQAQRQEARERARERPLRLRELALFYRPLSSMLAAGITVHHALDLLGEQTSRQALVARSLHQDVVHGHRLSLAMARFPAIFSAVQRALIKVGEETGSLDIVTRSLADHAEHRMKLRGKVIGALTYPVLVACFTLLGCMLAPPLFLNDFFLSLQSSGVALPPLTRLVMTLAAALWSPLVWLLAMASGYVGNRLWRKIRAHPDRARQLERALLAVPVFGPVRQAFFLLDFMQSLALQLEAGLRLDKSLLLSATVSDNAYLQERTLWVVDHVKSGDSLSFALRRARVFPRAVVEFVQLGEETGKMSDCLRYSEALLRERAEAALEIAQAMMEPLAISLVGILVGVVALACMLPLVRMFEAFL